MGLLVCFGTNLLKSKEGPEIYCIALLPPESVNVMKVEESPILMMYIESSTFDGINRSELCQKLGIKYSP